MDCSLNHLAFLPPCSNALSLTGEESVELVLKVLSPLVGFGLTTQRDTSTSKLQKLEQKKQVFQEEQHAVDSLLTRVLNARREVKDQDSPIYTALSASRLSLFRRAETLRVNLYKTGQAIKELANELAIPWLKPGTGADLICHSVDNISRLLFGVRHAFGSRTHRYPIQIRDQDIPFDKNKAIRIKNATLEVEPVTFSSDGVLQIRVPKVSFVPSILRENGTIQGPETTLTDVFIEVKPPFAAMVHDIFTIDFPITPQKKMALSEKHKEATDIWDAFQMDGGKGVKFSDFCNFTIPQLGGWEENSPENDTQNKSDSHRLWQSEMRSFLKAGLGESIYHEVMQNIRSCLPELSPSDNDSEIGDKGEVSDLLKSHPGHSLEAIDVQSGTISDSEASYGGTCHGPEVQHHSDRPEEPCTAVDLSQELRLPANVVDVVLDVESYTVDCSEPMESAKQDDVIPVDDNEVKTGSESPLWLPEVGFHLSSTHYAEQSHNGLTELFSGDDTDTYGAKGTTGSPIEYQDLDLVRKAAQFGSETPAADATLTAGWAQEEVKHQSVASSAEPFAKRGILDQVIEAGPVCDH